MRAGGILQLHIDSNIALKAKALSQLRLAAGSTAVPPEECEVPAPSSQPSFPLPERAEDALSIPPPLPRALSLSPSSPVR